MIVAFLVISGAWAVIARGDNPVEFYGSAVLAAVEFSFELHFFMRALLP